MKRYRTIIHVAALLALVGGSAACSGGVYSAQNIVDPSTLAEATTGQFPNQPAVVILNRRVHTYRFWNTTIEHTYIVKILTQEGIEKYGDFVSDLHYSDTDKYDIRASVQAPNGTVVEVSPEHMKKVAFGKVAYQYRGALPGIQVGSIITIWEKTESNVGTESGQWDFASDIPTLRSELVFKAPKGVFVAFNFTPQGAGDKPKPVSDEKFDVYTIVKKMVPPYRDEPYMSHTYTGNPSVFYFVWHVTREDLLRFQGIEYDARIRAFFAENKIPFEVTMPRESWQAIGEFFSRYFDPSTWKDGEYHTDCGEALRSISEAVAGRDHRDLERFLNSVLRVFDEKMQVVGLPFLVRNPDKAVSLGEGNPFELAYALNRVLRMCQLFPTVVLARDADLGNLDQRSPTLRALNHPLIVVDAGDERYWMDPCHPEYGVNHLSWKCQGVRGLSLNGEKSVLVTTPMDSYLSNTVNHREIMTIDGDGNATVQCRLTMTGQQAAMARGDERAGRTTTRNKRLLATLHRFCPGGDKGSIDIQRDTRDSLVVSHAYSLSGFATRSGSFVNLDFAPWSVTPFSNAFDEDARVYDIWFPFPTLVVSTVRVKAVGAYSIVQQADEVEHTDDWFSYRRVIYLDGNDIVFSRKCAVISPRIDVKDYQAAKATIDIIRKSDKESLVLKTNS